MLDWLLGAVLAIGAKAPDFTLPDQDGKSVSISSFLGKKNIILVFYPADATPGWTKQLCQLRDSWKHLLAKDTIAFGVNGGDAKSHQDFKTKNDFPFPLLIDDGRKVTKLYHADMWVAANRTVYLIGKDGTIRFAKRGMPPPSEVLTAAQ